MKRRSDPRARGRTRLRNAKNLRKLGIRHGQEGGSSLHDSVVRTRQEVGVVNNSLILGQIRFWQQTGYGLSQVLGKVTCAKRRRWHWASWLTARQYRRW